VPENAAKQSSYLDFAPIDVAFAKPLSTQQNAILTNAVDLIEPAPEKHAECKKQTTSAFRSIEYCKLVQDSVPSPSAKKESLSSRAVKLRQAANVLERESLTPNFLGVHTCVVNSVKFARYMASAFESDATEIDVVGAPKVEEAKKLAVYHAQRLLVIFGKCSPGLTQGGRWHRLSKTLYGDSIDFDYLRRERERQKELHALGSPLCLLRKCGKRLR
jgi:hypothetical protein